MTKHVSSFINSDDPPSPKYEGVSGDKTVRIYLYWRHPGEKAETKETHDQITDNPEQWCRDIIKWFNDTLRPHERRREFVRCEIVGEVPPAEHKWSKTSLATRTMVGGARHGSMYDAMECERCGITGKRYGLNGFVKRDTKYRLRAFERCDTSMKKLGKWTDNPHLPRRIRPR